MPQRNSRANASPDPDDVSNRVLLRGRVSTGPAERVLPSGSRVVSLRVSVVREASPMTQGSRQRNDWVDCCAWGAGARRSVGRWAVGDLVEVEGALRRRFFRGQGGPSTRLEVEVLKARLVSRAASGAG